MGNVELIVKAAFSLFLFKFCSLAYCSKTYDITSSKPVSSEQILTSPHHVFELGFFSPKNSLYRYVGIWFKEVSPKTVVWVANRSNPVMDSSASFTIGLDGNLMLLDGQNRTIWSTVLSASSNGSIATLTDNGSLVIRDQMTGTILWDSGKNPSDTLLPGRWLAFNGTGGERLTISSWRSENDPSVGDFTAGVSGETPPQVFVWKGEKPHWRSGLWDRSIFIGIPEMDSDYESGLALIEGVETGTAYLSVGVPRNCSYSMLRLSSSGVLRFLCWVKTRGWYSRWEAPVNPCEIYGACGTFGVCLRYEPNLSCKCLKGFEPNSDEEWKKRHWTRGCERRNELNCGRNGTNNSTQRGNSDGFLKVSGLRFPDFSRLLKVQDLNECSLLCQNNCSCSGYAYADGIGCLVWTGQLVDMHELPFGGKDLYLRLADSELRNGWRKNKHKLTISLVAILSFAVVAAIIFGFLKLRTRRRSSTNGGNKSPGDFSVAFMWQSSSDDKDPLELHLFDFNCILAATNNFDADNKLGQGGYGPVYKGNLPDGKHIAVKRLSSSSGQGINEFKNEVKLISKLQHRNLVKLIGCCIEREEKMLIYEFMSNKSLDNYLFDPAKKAELDWAKRFNIVTGIARGLLYLHRDSCLRIIHRDLKVSNILLDDDMTPKISDFGLARIFEGTQYLGTTHRVVGTIGYMAPEYILGGLFSEKSDVYGFGVLTLEIVSGKKACSVQFDEQDLSLLAFAWQSWSKTRGLDMIDEAMVGSFSASEVRRCVNIGLLCVQDQATERPTMAAIVSMLSAEKTELPEPKQPVFTFLNVPIGSVRSQSSSVNNVTETTIEPR